MRSRIELWSGRAGSLALVAGLLLAGTSAFAQQLRNDLYRVVVLDETQGQPSETYWIGVACGELTDALRAQLELPEGQGVLIDDVLPDSPAAQAGLKKHDVIVSVGDKPLTNPQDLVEAVAQAKDTELSLQVVRVAKKLSIALKPAKRPQQPGEPAVVDVPAEADVGRLQELIQQLMKQQGDAKMRVRMMRPGMVLPPGTPLPPGSPYDSTLPDNLSISITRHGKEPAKISVKQGEKNWELTDDKLQELPHEIRMHVERMLGRMPMMAGLAAQPRPYQPRVAIVEPEPRQVVPAPAVPGGVAPSPPRVTRRMLPEAGAIDQRLDELSRQVRELREAIEKLQKQGEGSQK